RVPVLLGGGPTPANFSAIAEYGDGWMPIGGSGLGAAIPELRRAFEVAGRDPSTAQVVPFGTIPTEDKLAHFAELGVDEVVLRVPGGSRSEILDVLDAHAVFVTRFGGSHA
ncbi:MAG TPA: LLM class F420-dependent oxidoreductase, partial [Acidimicrobiales bacterium]|nr:LLM class F420-dependent oxidoreductase [Acidimicrobiales bacterium]